MNEKNSEIKKILFADDDEAFRFTLNEYFVDSPWEIDFAENGVVALDKALSTQYDLIILDINMPFMKGTEALKAIKSRWPQVMTIAFTAISTFEEKENYFKMGFNDVIAKPLSLQGLHKKILQFLTPDLNLTANQVSSASITEETIPAIKENVDSNFPQKPIGMEPLQEDTELIKIDEAEEIVTPPLMTKEPEVPYNPPVPTTEAPSEKTSGEPLTEAPSEKTSGEPLTEAPSEKTSGEPLTETNEFSNTIAAKQLNSSSYSGTPVTSKSGSMSKADFDVYIRKERARFSFIELNARSKESLIQLIQEIEAERIALLERIFELENE